MKSSGATVNAFAILVQKIDFLHIFLKRTGRYINLYISPENSDRHHHAMLHKHTTRHPSTVLGSPRPYFRTLSFNGNRSKVTGAFSVRSRHPAVMISCHLQSIVTPNQLLLVPHKRTQITAAASFDRPRLTRRRCGSLSDTVAFGEAMATMFGCSGYTISVGFKHVSYHTHVISSPRKSCVVLEWTRNGCP